LVLGDAFVRTVYLVKGSTGPDLQITLKDQDGNPVDLTGATVTFSMVNTSTGATKVNAASATVTDAAGGKFKYSWGASDLDEAGNFLGEFTVTVGTDVQKIYEGLNIVVRESVS